MNIAEIISYARSEILDDAIAPYLWSDSGLVMHFNRAYEEFARETACITDSSTTSTCVVNLLANQTLHALSAKVIYVFNGWLESDGTQLLKKTEAFMDDYTNWRATTGTSPYWLIMDSQEKYFSLYPKYGTTGYIAGSADIQFVASTNRITKVGATFKSHYATGDELVVTGTTLNNGTFTITGVDDTYIAVSGTLVNEANQSAILQLVCDKANLRVARLPITLFTVSDLALSTPPTPEISAAYHYGLLDGLAKYAYLKQDSEAYDPQKSERHAAIFEQFKSRVSFETSSMMDGNWSQCTPQYGAI